VTDIFLNQLVDFFWNNATNLYNLTQYAVLPHNKQIVGDHILLCRHFILCIHDLLYYK